MDYVSLVAESCAPLLNLHWVLAVMLGLVGIVLQVADARPARWLLACQELDEVSPADDVADLSAELATARAEWVAALRRHVELRAELLVVEREIRRVVQETAGWRRAAGWRADAFSGLLVAAPVRSSALWAEVARG